MFYFFLQKSSPLNNPEYYRTCVIMHIRRQGARGMWLKTLSLLKNVIFTVKTMMWMSTHESVPPWTLLVWEHLLVLLPKCKLFRVRIAEGKYEFWWLCILENGAWNLQRQITQIRHEDSYKQLEVKMNIVFMRKSYQTPLYGTHNVTHNRTTQKTKKMSNTDPKHQILEPHVLMNRKVVSQYY